jgi:hypothetical protein
MKTRVLDLKEKGFVSIPYPLSIGQAVEKTAESWKRFCALPPEVKKNLPYSNGGAGVGYEMKDGIGKNADRKENFDVTTVGAAWLEANASAIREPAALEFVRNATELIGIVKPTILAFARDMEKTFRLRDFA